MNPLAAIHVGRKQLDLDEDTYRSLLERTTGKRSAKDLTPAESRLVLDELRRLGFEPTPPASRRPARQNRSRASGPFAAKLQALWIAAWNLGVVHHRDDAAMIAFCERQTGLSHTRFLNDANDLRRVVEALKKWLAREAGVDWARRSELVQLGDGSQVVRPHLSLPQYRIAEAQWRKLVELGAVVAVQPSRNPSDLGSLETAYGYRVTGKGGFQFYQPADWIALMNALGRKLRTALAGKTRTGRAA